VNNSIEYISTSLRNKSILLFLFIVLAIGAYAILSKMVRSADGWYYRVQPAPVFSTLDSKIKKIGENDKIKNADYEKIFTYFIEGINVYRTENLSQIVYPGVPGTRGITIEGLEGFARTAPMLATWISSGRKNQITLLDGSDFDILSHLVNGIVEGTNQNSTGYWGDFDDFDQRVVEAADIALTIWLLIDNSKDAFNKSELDNIRSWLKQVNYIKIYGGNWFLFRLIINSVLSDINGDSSLTLIEQDYYEFKSYYIGDGWFSDGKNGHIDYYNVWQMQYMLFWFSEIKPAFDNAFILDVFEKFSKNYKYFISPKGIPIFGRSSCYRLAVSIPLIIPSLKNKNAYKGAIARRGMDVSWSYFLEKGAVKSGTVTQGYFGAEHELMENYSGRGSCLWSLRSLVLAFYSPLNGGVWNAKKAQLPIENESYEIELKGPQLKVVGNKETQEITIEQLSPSHRVIGISDQPLIAMPVWRKFAEQVLRRPLRLENYEVKYGRLKYSSAKPFCNCVTDSDNLNSRFLKRNKN